MNRSTLNKDGLIIEDISNNNITINSSSINALQTLNIGTNTDNVIIGKTGGTLQIKTVIDNLNLDNINVSTINASQTLSLGTNTDNVIIGKTGGTSQIKTSLDMTNSDIVNVSTINASQTLSVGTNTNNVIIGKTGGTSQIKTSLNMTNSDIVNVSSINASQTLSLGTNTNNVIIGKTGGTSQIKTSLDMTNSDIINVSSINALEPLNIGRTTGYVNIDSRIALTMGTNTPDITIGQSGGTLKLNTILNMQNNTITNVPNINNTNTLSIGISSPEVVIGQSGRTIKLNGTLDMQNNDINGVKNIIGINILNINGKLGVNNNYGTNGQFLKSQGPNLAPIWSTIEVTDFTNLSTINLTTYNLSVNNIYVPTLLNIGNINDNNNIGKLQIINIGNRNISSMIYLNDNITIQNSSDGYTATVDGISAIYGDIIKIGGSPIRRSNLIITDRSEIIMNDSLNMSNNSILNVSSINAVNRMVNSSNSILTIGDTTRILNLRASEYVNIKGKIQINDNYGITGQVLMSQGSNNNPIWSYPFLDDITATNITVYNINSNGNRLDIATNSSARTIIIGNGNISSMIELNSSIVNINSSLITMYGALDMFNNNITNVKSINNNGTLLIGDTTTNVIIGKSGGTITSGGNINMSNRRIDRVGAIYIQDLLGESTGNTLKIGPYSTKSINIGNYNYGNTFNNTSIIINANNITIGNVSDNTPINLNGVLCINNNYGTNGQFLKSQGPNLAPIWSTIEGTGTNFTNLSTNSINSNNNLSIGNNTSGTISIGNLSNSQSINVQNNINLNNNSLVNISELYLKSINSSNLMINSTNVSFINNITVYNDIKFYNPGYITGGIINIGVKTQAGYTNSIVNIGNTSDTINISGELNIKGPLNANGYGADGHVLTSRGSLLSPIWNDPSSMNKVLNMNNNDILGVRILTSETINVTTFNISNLTLSELNSINSINASVNPGIQIGKQNFIKITDGFINLSANVLTINGELGTSGQVIMCNSSNKASWTNISLNTNNANSLISDENISIISQKSIILDALFPYPISINTTILNINGSSGGKGLILSSGSDTTNLTWKNLSVITAEYGAPTTLNNITDIYTPAENISGYSPIVYIHGNLSSNNLSTGNLSAQTTSTEILKILSTNISTNLNITEFGLDGIGITNTSTSNTNISYSMDQFGYKLLSEEILNSSNYKYLYQSTIANNSLSISQMIYNISSNTSISYKSIEVGPDYIVLPNGRNFSNSYLVSNVSNELTWFTIPEPYTPDPNPNILPEGLFLGIDPNSIYTNASGPQLGFLGYVNDYDLTKTNYGLNGTVFHNLETANISAGVYILNYSYKLNVNANQTDVSARILIGTSNASNDINSANIYIDNEPYTNMTTDINEYYRNITTTHVVTNNLQTNTIYINYNCINSFNVNVTSLSFRATRIG